MVHAVEATRFFLGVDKLRIESGPEEFARSGVVSGVSLYESSHTALTREDRGCDSRSRIRVTSAKSDGASGAASRRLFIPSSNAPKTVSVPRHASDLLESTIVRRR